MAEIAKPAPGDCGREGERGGGGGWVVEARLRRGERYIHMMLKGVRQHVSHPELCMLYNFVIGYESKQTD